MMKMRLVTLASIATAGLLFSGCANNQTVKDTQNENAKLRAEIDQLKSQNQMLLARSATMQSKSSGGTGEVKMVALDDSLKALGVSQAERSSNIALILPGEKLFTSGSYNITPNGKKVLNEVIKFIKKNYPDAGLRVEGHTDATPYKHSRRTNWELSGDRAYDVLHHLLEEGKFDPKRLSFAGYGEYDPLYPGEKAKNRRVEIVIFQP